MSRPAGSLGGRVLPRAIPWGLLLASAVAGSPQAWAQGAEPDEEGVTETAPAPTAPAPGCRSGNCADGFGVLVRPNGSRYEGRFVAGRPHGRGVLFASPSGDAALKAGTFREGESVVSPTDEVLVVFAAEVASRFFRTLPSIVSAARNGFDGERLGSAPVQVAGPWVDEAWETRLGRDLDPRPRIVGTGSNADWAATLGTRSSPVSAAILALATCAGVAASFGRGGDTWMAKVEDEGCWYVSRGGTSEGMHVIVDVRKDPEGRYPVVVSVGKEAPGL